MKLYSTNDPRRSEVDLATAVFQALPADRGLYMPTRIPELPEAFWSTLPESTFPEIAYAAARNLIGDDLGAEELRRIAEYAVDFPTPLVQLSPKRAVLELFHGPSLAFKDFGARFMAGVMDALLAQRGERLQILVATSGDTGGAVAAGFRDSERVRVLILYPAGKVSGRGLSGFQATRLEAKREISMNGVIPSNST